MNALQLVSFDDEGKAVLHEENFQSVFGHDEVRNRHVVIIAAAGSFRRGKSFFLNYLIRFLRTQGDKSFTATDRISGFDWKYGLDRVTTGICIWPEVFFVNDLAVVLIDSQGTFDKKTSMKVNTAVVAFSALISSVQIFNYHERFDSQDFMNLEFFMKYGEILQRDNFNQHGQKFFQKLLFLIRDWNHEVEFPYGYDGGLKYLKNFVATDNNTDLESVNGMLRTCFDEVACYLMPHPGEKVSSSGKFNGLLKDIDEKFLDHIYSLASSLLLPGNLVPKRIAGNLVTSGQLMQHIRACVSLFNSNELPEPRTMYNVLVDEISGGNRKEARQVYCKLMNEAMQNKTLGEDQFNSIHHENTTAAIQHFRSNQKIGSDSQKKKHEAMLHENIRDDFLRFTEIMTHQREIKKLRMDMELQNEKNKELQKIVFQLKNDIDEKQKQIDWQNNAIYILQEKMQDAERMKAEQDEKLASLHDQLEQMTEMNGEQQERNDKLKALIDEQAEKMKNLEKNLEEEMECGPLTKFVRIIAKPVEKIAKKLDEVVGKLFNLLK